ncbi:MAG: hypothetical protein NC048_09865 [Bacteroides sp.]|nr:hypothetical protein [Bacteroides sp.]
MYNPLWNVDPWASYDRMFSPEFEGEREAAKRRAEEKEEAAIQRWEDEQMERLYCNKKED